MADVDAVGAAYEADAGAEVLVRGRPSRGRGDRMTAEERRGANADRRAARAELVAAWAAASSNGVFTKDEVARIRRCVKHGSAATMRKYVFDLEARVRAVSAAVEPSPAESGDAEPPTPHPVASKTPRTRAVRRRRSLSTLPTLPAPNLDASDGVAGAVARKPTRSPPRGQAEPLSRSRPLHRVAIAEDDRRSNALTQRERVVSKMQDGLSASEALEALGEEVTPASLRRAQRWAKIAEERHGDLQDRRWGRTVAANVLTPPVETLILMLFNGRPGASAAEIHRQLVAKWRLYEQRDLLEGPLPESPPSYSAVRSFIQGLPGAVHKARGGRLELWRKAEAFTVPVNIAHYANHVWQIDHCELHIWVRVEIAPREWDVFKVWTTLVIDTYSRAVVDYVMSIRTPSAWSILRALRKAIGGRDDETWPMHGCPTSILVDNGRDYKSHDFQRGLEGLHIELLYARPHVPNDKPEVERFFRTLHGRLAGLPGAMAAGASRGSAERRKSQLLTLDLLKVAVDDFVREYNEREHGTTKRKPVDLWRETVQYRPVDAQRLDLLLLKSEVRRVTREGIRFSYEHRGGQYFAYGLQDYVGQDVILRFNPDEMYRVLVCHPRTGEPLCEASLLDDPLGVSRDDVKAMRVEYAKSLRKRTRDFRREVEEQDRHAAAAVTASRDLLHRMRELEAEAAARPTDAASLAEAAEDDPMAIAHARVEEFRRRQRAEASPPLADGQDGPPSV